MFKIQCRDRLFEVTEDSLKAIPFFAPVIGGSFPTARDEVTGAMILDLDPTIFNVVLKSTHRLSSLLRSLPKDESVSRVFEMMDYLLFKLDVNDWPLTTISDRLKDNSDYVDKIARHCYETVKGNIKGAMDAA
eukprot:gene7493-8766_t